MLFQYHPLLRRMVHRTFHTKTALNQLLFSEAVPMFTASTAKTIFSDFTLRVFRNEVFLAVATYHFAFGSFIGKYCFHMGSPNRIVESVVHL
jgi:hypothetical protein